MIFCPKSVGKFFCPERLGDYFCPDRLGDFFCPERLGDRPCLLFLIGRVDCPTFCYRSPRQGAIKSAGVPDRMHGLFPRSVPDLLPIEP